MSATRRFRQWHRWISILVTPALLIILLSGVLLATRGFNPWLQPDYASFHFPLRTSFETILDTCRSVPEARIQSWSDVSQIDIRPAQGFIRVRSKHNMVELQINGATGELIAHGIRRVSFLSSIHEGAYFGPWVRYGIFFASAVGAVFLTLSGIVLLVSHVRHKLQLKREMGPDVL